MGFRIELGIPEMRDFFEDLLKRAKNNTLDNNEKKLFKKLTKAMSFLSADPMHNSLNSHEIEDLSRRYSKKAGTEIRVWQSYLENHTPSAGRIYWVYGPVRGVITLIGLEPHPEDKKKAGYAKVALSDLPEL
jgi:hypothetical protein